MINNVIVNELDPDKTYLHIDVGGGSTELNVYNGKIKETSQSFKIGSVRLMEGKVNRDMWKKMQRWIADNVPTDQPVYAIGTGGNISKIFEYVPKDEYGMGTLEDIEKAVEYFNQYTFEERVNKLKMNPDRADVVTYAADIYLSAMRWAKANLMAVPDLGLKDGIMLEVYQNLLKEA